ncbi:hypothetical protein F5Y05DRAFT_335403 [Hypoxylon sp. FL0543]|nr:hypothetical protein F5Y05DRAFT_335403 [Hypoxylon sp. FL0543]
MTSLYLIFSIVALRATAYLPVFPSLLHLSQLNRSLKRNSRGGSRIHAANYDLKLFLRNRSPEAKGKSGNIQEKDR